MRLILCYVNCCVDCQVVTIFYRLTFLFGSQIREIRPTHVKGLVYSFTYNVPTQLNLTVVKDQGIFPFPYVVMSGLALLDCAIPAFSGDLPLCCVFKRRCA